MRLARNLPSIFLIIFYSCIAFAGTPIYTSFQTKIIAPSGLALENPAVNFRFTILDTVGTCVLYIEDYVAVNMTGSSGVVSFSLGSGTKSYPGTATSMSEVFNNSVTVPHACQAGGTYAPGSTDRRQIVMQFNDGSGWQTLPQMAINSVFYANYATTSEKLGNYVSTDYLRPATLPTCIAGQALHFNGTSFTCVAASGGGGTLTSVNVNSPLTVVNTTTTPVISLPKATGAVSGYLSSADWAAFNAKASATLSSGSLYIGNASNAATGVTLSGDATLNSSGDLSLKNSGVVVGTYGSASSVPAIAVDAKGRVTSATSTPYQNATGAVKGVVQVGSNISVAAGVISLTSNDVTSALGYTPPNATLAFVQNGNSFSANANVGTNDNYNLNFVTSGTPKVTVRANGNVGIGTITPATALEVLGKTTSTNFNATAAATAYQIGGTPVLRNDGTLNLFVGATAGNNTTAGENTFIGAEAGYMNATGTSNTYVGLDAGYDSTGSRNVFIGRYAGNYNYGSDNVFLGNESGSDADGSYNVFVGNMVSATTLNSTIAIGYHTTLSADHQFVLGSNDANGTITDAYLGQGITMVSPSGITLNSTGGSGADNSGSNLTLAAGKSTGNASPGSIILSTSDSAASGAGLQTLSEKMRIAGNGNVGIGTTTPQGKLDVDGILVVKSSVESIVSYVNTGVAYTISDTSVNIRQLTLDNNTTITLPAFTTPTNKIFSFTVFLKQDATGSRTATFLGNGSDTIKWDTGVVPTISTTAGKITIIQLIKPSIESTWYGSVVWKED